MYCTSNIHFYSTSTSIGRESNNEHFSLLFLTFREVGGSKDCIRPMILDVRVISVFALVAGIS